MADVLMYSTRNCSYCVRARQLLERKGIRYTEVRIDEQPQHQAEMIERSGRRTVPQIFIDGQPIGGCDELYALDRDGALDRLLGGAKD